MNKLFLLLVLSILSLSQVSAFTNTQLLWQGDTSDHKTITYGDSLRFTADVASYDPAVVVELMLQDENGNNKVVYLSESQYTHPHIGISSYSEIFEVTSEDYETLGDFKIVLKTIDQAEYTTHRELKFTTVPPTANLVVEASANPTNGKAPLDVDFGCVATGGYPEYTYNWNFGDGSDEDTQMANHVYNYEGTYTATCSVVDQYGNSGSDTVTIKVEKPIIPNDGPIADFTINPNPSVVGQEITLDASNSYDPNNDPLTYEWDIGNDGDIEFTGKIAYKTFFQAKNYPIKLTVSDGEKESSVVKYAIVKEYEDFEVFFTANPDEGYAPLTTTLDCAYILENDGNQLVSDYSVRIITDDGETINNGLAVHTYEEVGSYTPYCEITQLATGIKKTAKDYVKVTEEPYEDFSVELTANPFNGEAPLEVEFTCDLQTIGSGLEGDYRFAYDFGDGNSISSNSEQQSYTYINHGVYTPSCSAEQLQTGIIKSDSTKVYVNQPAYESFDVNIQVTPDEGFEPLEVQGFCEVETYNDGLQGNYEFHWEMGDGTRYNTQSITHTYNQAGVYEPDCEVTQIETGNIDSAATLVTVKEKQINNGPKAVLKVYPNPAYEGELVTFDATDSYDLDNDSLSYLWYVEGLYNGYSGPMLQLRVDNSGEYDIRLQVDDGKTYDEANDLLVVKEKNYEGFNILYSVIPQNGTAPLKVNAMCSPFRHFNGLIADYEVEMDFGDGTVIAGHENLMHVYENPGNYEYTCSVTQIQTGITKTGTKIVKVTEPISENLPPVALISGPSTIKQLEEATYDASSSFDPEGKDLTYVWYVDGEKVQEGQDKLTIQTVKLGTIKVTVKVYDPEGLSDEATTTTTVTRLDQKEEEETQDHEFTFIGTGIVGHDVNRVRAGDTLYVTIGTVSDDTKGRPSLIVPELGLKATGQLNDLEGRESMTMKLWIPPNTPPGDYMLRIGFKSEEVRKGEIRWFTVE